MSKRDKLIQKIMSGADITFAEAEKVLISLGYKSDFPQGGSSHKTFRKTGNEKLLLLLLKNP